MLITIAALTHKQCYSTILLINHDDNHCLTHNPHGPWHGSHVHRRQVVLHNLELRGATAAPPFHGARVSGAKRRAVESATKEMIQHIEQVIEQAFTIY